MVSSRFFSNQFNLYFLEHAVYINNIINITEANDKNAKSVTKKTLFCSCSITKQTTRDCFKAHRSSFVGKGSYFNCFRTHHTRNKCNKLLRLFGLWLAGQRKQLNNSMLPTPGLLRMRGRAPRRWKAVHIDL